MSDTTKDKTGKILKFKPQLRVVSKSDNPFRSFVGDKETYLTNILAALENTSDICDKMLIDGSLSIEVTKEDKMKNPLEVSEYPTPKNVNELAEYIAEFSGADKAIALMVMGMTWNLARKLVDERLTAEDK
tara:strand:+ start:5598 stop:5990 length:393 start_codon:yes stop_codon:yes gene_type:complete